MFRTIFLRRDFLMALHVHPVNTADTARAVSLFLGVSSTHPSIIAIASRISLEGLHIAPGTDLSRDPAFHARIMAVGGRELLEIVDPTRRAMFEQQGQHAGAHAFRYASLLGGLYGLGHAWSEDRGGDTGSSADYDVLSGSSTDYASPAGQARMRDYAHRCGMGWMANHPDLLRLGPEAIELFRRTNFQQGTHDRMREAQFNAGEIRDVVALADRRGLDANRLGNDMAGAIGQLGGDSEAERRRWAQMFGAWARAPDQPEARDRLRLELNRALESGTPAQREGAQRGLGLMQEVEGATVRADVAGATVQQDRAVVTAGNTELGNLLEEPAAPRPPPTPHVAGPR
jgi:hypothetical protein